MKMRVNKVLKIAPIFLAALLLVASCQKPLPKSVKTRQSKETVTFFFHGYGSSINAEKHMAEAAKQAGKTNEILTATVGRGGSVQLKGQIQAKPKNPIVLVGFKDNQNPDYHRDGWYAYKAVKAAQRRLGFKKMNLVGHSMGNMAICYMIMDDGGKKSFPVIEKQVSIAGHYNGIKGYSASSNSALTSSGKPEKMDATYKDLLYLRQVYPKGVAVLNIYGDIGNGSDERVYNNSSKSLKYLVVNGRSYQEVKIKGAKGQHSQLHENGKVDRVLQQFLWK